MVEPEAVAAMLRLKEAGWGSKRIARELGVSRTTVKRYLQAGGWRPFKKPKREKLLEEHGDWLKDGSGGIEATPMWFGRSSWPRGGSRRA